MLVFVPGSIPAVVEVALVVGLPLFVLTKGPLVFGLCSVLLLFDARLVLVVECTDVVLCSLLSLLFVDVFRSFDVAVVDSVNAPGTCVAHTLPHAFAHSIGSALGPGGAPQYIELEVGLEEDFAFLTLLAAVFDALED